MARTALKPDKAGGVQAPATSPDVQYAQGEVNTQAQDPSAGGIGLPDKRGVPAQTLQGSDGVVSASTMPPEQEALQAARGYNPSLTAMDAPDDFPDTDITAGLNEQIQSMESMHQRKMASMSRMLIAGLENSDDPLLRGMARKAKANGQI